MSFTIRRATPADLDSINLLLAQYYEDWQVQQRDSPAKTAADLAHPTLGFFVAEHAAARQAGELCACVLLRDLPQISSAAECKRLFVLPAHRGHHLATLLMDAAEQAVREAHIDWLYLDTTEDFAAALAMYRSRGYTDCPRYNDNPQATVFLRKSLSPA